mgnify:CR=1 FL=1
MSNPPPRKKITTFVEKSNLTQNQNLVVMTGQSNQSYGLQKLGQLWLWGIALAAIWGGLFTIAFAEGDTNNRFAMLAVGGLLSASLFFTIVDLQRRKHGFVTDLHDYMLAMSFFFAAAGLFWGIRYGVALLAEFGIDYFIHPDRPFTGMNSSDWTPSADTIYAQTAGAVLLAAMQWLYLKPMEADSRNMNTVSWFVACITPFALLLVGLGTWVDWSDGFVSYEIGISLVMLSAIAMLLSIESNNGLVFAITANVASFLTIVYELVHDSPSGSTTGGALSLMTFIIIAQGLLAASPRLERKLVEKASIGLIVAALIAMFYATGTEMTLHLGPLKFGPDNTYLTLPTMIWMTILVSYFAAVLDNRIPWMPIGLAASLILLPNPSNVIPWSICLVMIPYMLWNKKTRLWVANWTFGMFALSFFLVGWIDWMNEGDGLTHLPEKFDIIVAIVIIAAGEMASRSGKLNRNVFRFAIFCFVGSPATLISDDTLLPWIVALYLLSSVVLEQINFDEKGGFDTRKDMSFTMATSLTLTVLLAALDRLSLDGTPLSEIENQLLGFNLVLAIIAIAYFAIGLRQSKYELDFGILLAMMLSEAEKTASYNSHSQTWVVETNEEKDDEEMMAASWGNVARFSLLGPLLLFTVAIASVNKNELISNPLLVLLFALPVSALVNEVLKVEGAGSKERAISVWAMVIISMPLCFGIMEGNDGPKLNTASFLFDLILISAPITVHFVLLKKGLAPREELSKSADNFTLGGLFVIGLLDTTGGLALTFIFALLLWRTLMHRSVIIAYLLPWLWLFYPSRIAQQDGFVVSILEPLGTFGGWLTEYVDIVTATDYLSGINFTGLMLIIYSITVLGKSGSDLQLRKKNPELEMEKMPFVYPAVMLFLGLDILLVNDAWLLCIVTTSVLLFGWVAGRLEGFAFAPYAYFLSFLIAFGDTMPELTEWELLSLTCFGSGLVTFILWLASQNKILYRFTKEAITLDELKEQSHDNLIIKQPSMIRCATQEGRDKLSQKLKLAGMVLLLCAFEEIYGLPTLFVALWVTWEAWNKQDRTLFLLTPLMHSIAMWNIGRVAGIQDYDLAGWLLIVEGSILTYLSISKWYPDWNWNENGDDYWKWNDMMGVFGAAYGVAGILWTLWDLSEIGSAMLIIIYCGMQAASDFENSWRRVTSMIGTSLGTLLVLFSSVETTFKGIALIVGGLAAFAQAVLYFRLWGVDDENLKVSTTQVEVIEIVNETEPPKEDVEIPEPVTEEDDLDEFVEELELEDELESEEVVTEEVESEESRVSTDRGFEIELPPNVLGNILTALENTDTEGFTPVLGFDQAGQIILNFEPSSS